MNPPIERANGGMDKRSDEFDEYHISSPCWITKKVYQTSPSGILPPSGYATLHNQKNILSFFVTLLCLQLRRQHAAATLISTTAVINTVQCEVFQFKPCFDMEKYTLGAHLVHISKYKFCNITYLLPYDRKQSSLSMPHQHSHETNMGNLP